MTIDALVARISATLVDQLGAPVRTGACALSPIRRHFAPFCLGAVLFAVVELRWRFRGPRGGGAAQYLIVGGVSG